MDPVNVVSFGMDKSPLPDVAFEGYYNRDSAKYRALYHIPEAETIIRGTYRYKVRLYAVLCTRVCMCTCMCAHVCVRTHQAIGP